MRVDDLEAQVDMLRSELAQERALRSQAQSTSPVVYLSDPSTVLVCSRCADEMRVVPAGIDAAAASSKRAREGAFGFLLFGRFFGCVFVACCVLCGRSMRGLRIPGGGYPGGSSCLLVDDARMWCFGVVVGRGWGLYFCDFVAMALLVAWISASGSNAHPAI